MSFLISWSTKARHTTSFQLWRASSSERVGHCLGCAEESRRRASDPIRRRSAAAESEWVPGLRTWLDRESNGTCSHPYRIRVVTLQGVSGRQEIGYRQAYLLFRPCVPELQGLHVGMSQVGVFPHLPSLEVPLLGALQPSATLPFLIVVGETRNKETLSVSALRRPCGCILERATARSSWSSQLSKSQRQRLTRHTTHSTVFLAVFPPTWRPLAKVARAAVSFRPGLGQRLEQARVGSAPISKARLGPALSSLRARGLI